MLLIWLKFLVLLFLISLAAHLLSVQSEKIANRVGANFTGSVVLALITTLPEYLFVFWASVKGNFDVALGSTVGAASMLVTLGYGLVILVATTKISKKPVKIVELSQATRVDSFYLNFTALLALVLAWAGNGLSLFDGILLIACFGVYIYHSLKASRKAVAQMEENGARGEVLRKRTYALIALGAIIVVAASEPFVDSMIEIAHGLGIHPIAIAIILSPIASELPEKLTAFLTVRRDGKLAEISVCNFIGSKINHNSLLVGMIPIVSYATGHGFVSNILNGPFMMMTFLTVFAGLSVATRRLPRWKGYVFTGLFIIPVIMAYLSR
jgi:cation:H+ antiporter